FLRNVAKVPVLHALKVSSGVQGRIFGATRCGGTAHYFLQQVGRNASYWRHCAFDKRYLLTEYIGISDI
ncbi:MAG: hypothetical protein WBM58_19875, partial [Sedimenticolaceae bacterium]